LFFNLLLLFSLNPLIMKIKLLFILVTLLFFNNAFAQLTFIPDNNFEQYLIDEGIDSDATINGEVLTSDVAGVTILDIKDYTISNFEGLESFTSLKEFSLTSNLASTIENIKFGSGAELTTVFILEAPGLSGINVDDNTNLTSLQVVTLGDNFYDIYVKNNTKLTHLSLGNNALEFLDVTNNIELKTLLLDGNPIGNIDVSKNTNLETLFCRDCTLLTAVDLDDGSGSTNLNSVLLTGCPELLCIKVDNIANAESASGWEKDSTSSFVEDFGPPFGDPGFSTTSSEGDAGVDGTFNLDDLFGVDSESSSINKSLVAKKRRRWRRSRRNNNKNNTVEVDFPNKGAGTQYYDFQYIVTNDCGVEEFYDVEVIIQDGFHQTEDINISLCDNTEKITVDFLNSNLNITNYEGGEWFGRHNGDWIDSSDPNFKSLEFFKYLSDHDLNVLGDEPEFIDLATTLSINYIPCSVKYSFANGQNTNEGSKNFYEVDVLIESSLDFKLGSGELFFNYNREAFGENIASNGKIELTHPSNYILGEVYEYPAYKGFEKNDDGGGFGIPYYQAKSYSLMPVNNITSTPKNLFHLKIEYLDVNKSPDVVFLEPTGSLKNRTNTACGPYTSFNLPDCNNYSGAQITDITFENSGAVLSVGDEILANSILIYPNPVSNNLTINSKTPLSKVEIYSVLGNKISEVNSNFESISLDNLSKGMYLVRVFSEKNVAIKKIVKQ